MNHFFSKLIFLFLLALSTASPIKHFTCTGKAEIKIDGHSLDEKNLLELDEKSLKPHVGKHLSIDDDVLSISGGSWSFNAPLHALNSFAVLKNCHVTAKNWNGTIRNLNVESVNDTFLEGFYHIDTINHNGKGRLMVYWIDDHGDLILNASEGKSFLAGDSKNFVVSINGTADVDASHFRATKILAKTKNNSKIILHPLTNLSVFAQDDSNVIYTTPVRQTNINSFNKASVFLEPLEEQAR
ncbi:MAG: hypothetical protein CMF41_03425 [Legionellales bacterium]|nr:hypothetical protein [Legionellales bacterium]OUX65337.1 MAG: hypothetical protein CBE41_01840 [Gammaproteobacteria bacterium TMED281]|tara:strand:+ start:111 stop:833 length:723 start_codon:yes stop_codon:yes gene_type:complete